MSGAILVTGATGFVGRALIAALKDDPRPVVALVRAFTPDLPAHVIQRIAGDIETLDEEHWLTALEGIDTVIHLAAIAHIGPGVPEDRYDAVNHRAVAALAAAARLTPVRRIVFMSSIRAQTGATHADILTVDSAPAPTDAYGRAKLAGERALAASGIGHVILRPVLIVGPEAKGNLKLLLRLADTALPLPFAGITAGRSMVSLADVVASCIRAIDGAAMEGKTLILADPEPLTLPETLAALRAGLGRPARLFALPGWLLALPFRLIGRSDLWDRIGGPLVARPDAAFSPGQPPVLPVRQALLRQGQAYRTARQRSE